MFRADLHCHTTFSDGTMEPKEVVHEACRRGLLGLAFTDHDDVGAHRVAVETARAAGVALVPGVELSCMEKGESVHILGYGFDIDAMHAICVDYKQLRDERNALMFERLAAFGMPLEIEALQRSGSLGRPQIALAMAKKGYVGSFGEAFEKWIGDDKPAFVKVQRYSVLEGIKHIHSCKGFAVLAHPHLIRHEPLLAELLAYPFDGIEAHYARMSPARSQRFEHIAKERGWFITGGSDFHGAIKSQATLGSSWSEEAVFLKLQGGRP